MSIKVVGFIIGVFTEVEINYGIKIDYFGRFELFIKSNMGGFAKYFG